MRAQAYTTTIAIVKKGGYFRMQCFGSHQSGVCINFKYILYGHQCVYGTHRTHNSRRLCKVGKYVWHAQYCIDATLTYTQ